MMTPILEESSTQQIELDTVLCTGQNIPLDSSRFWSTCIPLPGATRDEQFDHWPPIIKWEIHKIPKPLVIDFYALLQ